MPASAGYDPAMTEYKTIMDGPRDFGVEVTACGRYTSVRGFPTEAAVRAWIAEQEAAEIKLAPQPTPGS
jgi:hypothetical protein